MIRANGLVDFGYAKRMVEKAKCGQGFRLFIDGFWIEARNAENGLDCAIGGLQVKREVDECYPFYTDDHGMPYLPKGVRMDGELYILPNGKYLPSGAYLVDDGSTLIYEPHELSPFADMLASCLGK